MRADAVVVKIPTRDAVVLLWSRAATRAEEMTAFARIRAEAAALVALRTAVLLGELLTIFLAVAPASLGAVFVALRTNAFRRSEGVVVQIRAVGVGYDFFPVDGFDVAEVVVAEEPDASP